MKIESIRLKNYKVFRDVHLKDMPSDAAKVTKMLFPNGEEEDDTGHSSTNHSEVYPV